MGIIIGKKFFTPSCIDTEIAEKMQVVSFDVDADTVKIKVERLMWGEIWTTERVLGYRSVCLKFKNMEFVYCS